MTGNIFKILIISNNKNFPAFVADKIVRNFAPSPEIKICGLNSGRITAGSYKPLLIVLDIDCDNRNMADYLIHLVPKYSLPVIVCTHQAKMKYPMLSAGAMDVITIHPNEETRFAVRLCDSIERFSQAIFSKTTIEPEVNASNMVVAIGGSTGSTEALPVILNKLTGNIPPIVAVLHMPEGYTKIYAEQLNKTTRFDVEEAHSGIYLEPNKVIIAAGNKHLRVFCDKKGYFVTSEPGVRISGHCPSVNVLFDSVAYSVKSHAIGVILTGMGNDGSTGLLNMRNHGSYNIGQSEKSSVVYGMPKVAYDIGAVSKQSDLENIAQDIMVAAKMKGGYK